MKKIIFFVLLLLISVSASTVIAGNSNPKKATNTVAIPAKTETRLTEKQVTQLKNRVEEIRDMNKTKMTATEKLGLRKELKDIQQTIKRDGGYIIIGSGTLLLIIILLIILL